MFEELNVTALVDELAAIVTTYGLKVIGAIVVFVIGRMVASKVRNGITKMMNNRGVDPTLIPFIGGLVYWLLIAIVVVAVLQAFGVNAAGLVAVLGAAGLAVGLALQGTLANFASGVMLLIFRPFGVGDLIDAGGTSGIVESIGLFSTTLNSLDNVRIEIPNGNVFGQTIMNYSANESRRIDLVIGVSYDDDLGTAKETMTRIVAADSRVLAEPETTIEVLELGDSSVNFVVRPWVKTDDYWPTRFALTRELKEGIEAAGLSFPYPQQDVHMHQVG
ncbi:MAG: mechanosensitive ion channel domain-containing protein [Gemmatimonadota bacterium]